LKGKGIVDILEDLNERIITRAFVVPTMFISTVYTKKKWVDIKNLLTS
jgi:hypothetical protein